jgi:hypothetical protein
MSHAAMQQWRQQVSELSSEKCYINSLMFAEGYRFDQLNG